ncbi:MAG: hypothetical protein A4E74_01539 [Syntrophus sp. PtaB.Bin075]|nr:MAG: hypothetical protein A4E74_01539 [Syntrophus sp. PtaB.Bin075]
MSKLTTYEKNEIAHQKTSDISFRFGEKDKLQPAGFDALGPDKVVTVIIKGKTKSFSSGDEWDKSKRLTLEPDSIKILTDEAKDVSLSAALKAADSTRKKVK